MGRDPYRENKRNYIPDDEIDMEERDERRREKKGSIFNVLLTGVIVISLITFLFILLDSGIFMDDAQPMYGSPQASAGSGSVELTQEQKKQAEEEARKKAEAEKEKERKEQEKKRAEEEAERKAKEEEEARKAEEEAKKKAEEKKKKEEEEKEKEAERRRELEEEQEVLSGDYILPDSSTREYSESELDDLTDREVIYAINEIYARKGRIFTGEEFKRYFESKNWYRGTIPAEEFDANQNERFNETERANINKLVRIAEERGLR